MHTPHLVILDGDENLRTRLARAVQPLGWTTANCSDVHMLYDYLGRRSDVNNRSVAMPNIGIILRSNRATQDAVIEVVGQLRRMHSVTIAVQCCDEPAARIGFLEVGADVCVPAACELTELVAMLKARMCQHQRLSQPSFLSADGASNGYGGVRPGQSRTGFMVADDGCDFSSLEHRPQSRSSADFRSMSEVGSARQNAQPAALGQLRHSADAVFPSSQHQAYGTWVLSYQDWVLINPHGTHISLTGVERKCFSELLDNERCELSRARASAGGQPCMKSMSVVISRMRKKINRSGVSLPLHTVHGNGYVFIGTLVRQGAA